MIFSKRAEAALELQARRSTYQFMSHERGGLYFLSLIDTAKLAGNAQIEPVYTCGFQSPEDRDFMGEWLFERRAKWQEWGSMARLGSVLLAHHISEQLLADPIGEGYRLHQDADDSRTLILSELLQSPKGQVQQKIWQQTFQTPRKCSEVQFWLVEMSGRIDQLAALVRDGHSPAIDAFFAAQGQARRSQLAAH